MLYAESVVAGYLLTSDKTPKAHLPSCEKPSKRTDYDSVVLGVGCKKIDDDRDTRPGRSDKELVFSGAIVGVFAVIVSRGDLEHCGYAARAVQRLRLAGGRLGARVDTMHGCLLRQERYSEQE